jgi:hypothetical protein
MFNLTYRNEEVLIQRLIRQETAENQIVMPTESSEKPEEKKGPKEKRWKQKFIQIWKYNEQMQREAEIETTIGPENFVPIMKLGQGSFGNVYLVEKIRFGKDG